MIIKIFKNPELKIKLPTFIDSRALICANSGGGKSYAIRKILEESSNKVMSIVLDVEGEFRTLREKYDFLLIGSDGDVDLNIKSAKLLPRKIMGLEVSTIIDISDLKRYERIRYVKDFLESLMELPRKEGYWKPCLVVLDEAHLLAGQQEKQDSCSAVIDLMTRGRKRGYCGVLCTQRISKLHKDAVAEANNIMIGRTGLDIDMKRASDILGFTSKQDMLSLRDLDAGEFYVFGTAISKQVTKAKVGLVKTTHPQVGMDLRRKIIEPPEKVIKILSKLKDLPQEAEKELRELNDYKKEVMELKRENRQLKLKKHDGVDEKTVRQLQEQRKSLNEAELSYRKSIANVESKLNKFRNFIRKFIEEGSRLANIETPKLSFESIKSETHIKSLPHINVKPSQPLIKEKIPSADISVDNYNLNLCERKLYSLLFQYSDRGFSKSQIGVFIGYSHRSGGFNNSISRLRQLGLIEGSGSHLKAKELNSDIAQEFDFSKEAIISKLNKCEKEIYAVLLENPYETYGKEELADATQTRYSSNSGGFNNAISRLNTLGLLQRSEGMIKLNPELLEI